jgi:hypothetical protein
MNIRGLTTAPPLLRKSRAYHYVSSPNSVAHTASNEFPARLLALPALLLAFLALSAAPALAAPSWGIEMTHANAYGAQAASCPGGHKSLPGEPVCGVDPYTGSGTTFARESGFNTYTITAKNTAAPPAGPTAGETLSCETGTWEHSPSFSYRWLRNGVPISGAEAAEYILTIADEGKAIQCEVTGTSSAGAVSAITTALTVSPAPATAPPVLKSKVHVPGESGTFKVTDKLTCEPGEWSASPAFSYHWLRNGAPIAGAESATYELAPADEGASVQCEVAATNAGGSVIGENRYFTMVESFEEPPYVEEGNPGPSIPRGGSSTNETTGPVTVADQLPEGLVLEGTGAGPAVSSAGWRGGAGEGSCKVASGAAGFTCTTSNPLAPGESYPPITVHVRVSGEAPVGSPPSGGVTNTAAVSGGGAATALGSDPTTIAPAVPFGIQSFTTSVTEALGNPFTQAGGHPFAANATFAFNNTVDNEGGMQTAGGTPKDIETELPPGFIGDPQNTTRCTDAQIQQHGEGPPKTSTECPAGSVVGFVRIGLGAPIEGGVANPFPATLYNTFLVYNLEPSPGYPAAFGFVYGNTGAFFALNAKLRSDGDYGVTIGDSESATGAQHRHGVQALSLTLCSYGITGYSNEAPHEVTPATVACAAPTAGVKPFLTNPTQCNGPAPVTTLIADTYENPAAYVSKTVYTGTNLTGATPSASESFVTGCDQLRFGPEVEFKPSQASEGGTTQADEPTAATFALRVPQTNEAGVNATSELKNATVTLPEGMTVDPSAADGLQACSNAQFGLGSTSEPAEPAACPLASQIGTVKVITPLLEKALEGQVFIGEPECSPCSATDAEDGHIVRLFLQVRSVERGVVVKLAGHVSANPVTGRLQATFTQQPQLPFSELLLTLTGGARASLANPQTCGTFTTTTDLTPWSAPGLGGLSGTEAIAGTPDATPSGSFNVDWNGAGGACPGSLPFSPSFTAGSQTPTAGAASPFSVTFGREDREQDISAVTLTTPPGLLGEVSQVPRCPEAQANAGTCGPESLIGSTTVGAGPGPHPFYLSGKVYLTGPYKGQPFGLSIVVPAVAGPFNLGTVVVRSSIAVNPSTAALTIASDPLPQFVDGVQLRLRRINVEVNRPGFVLNPTSCAAQVVGATITAAQGASSNLSTPFEVGGCASLPFTPSFSASTQAKTSKANGASLTVIVRSATGQANIQKVDLQLPKVLPSRLTTLQKACTEAQFNANPAGCPAGSDIGTARALTPILNTPLTGPAYLVSHGGAAFPDVEFVLQGEGITIVLDGKTDIKKGITYSRFETVPDAPISLFETSLPEGPHSILGAYLPANANSSMCGQHLTIPTIITAQNGKQIKQTTKIAVTGCKASKPSVKITKTKLKGNTLLVTVKTSATGTISISGSGLKTTTKKNVNAGTHAITVSLTKAGKTAKKHRKKTKLRASLTVGKQAAATTTSVKL